MGTRTRRAIVAVAASLLAATTVTALSAVGAGAAAKPRGEPVKIGLIYTEGVVGIDLPALKDGADAAADLLNAGDGIAGRPVEIVACNDRGDPAKDAACAREFVDEDVLAVTGLGAGWGDNGLSVIAQANIPFVGFPISTAEFVGVTSYPISGGSPAAFPALAKYFIGKKVEKVSILYPDLGVAKLAADALLGDRFKAAGVTDVTLVPEKLGAADFTPAVVRASEGDPDVIFTLFSAADCARILQAASQLGVKAAWGATPGCADEAAFQEVDKSVADRVVLPSDTLFYRASEDDAAIYRRAMKKYAGAKPDFLSSITFSQVMTLAVIGDELGPDGLGAAGILEALKGASGVPVFMGTELDSSNAAELVGVKINVFNTDQRIIRIRNGKFVDAAGNRWWNGYAAGS